MNVTALPDWRDANPYQRLLAEALEQLHVYTVFPEGYRRILPLWRAVSPEPRPDILHLHWPSAYLRDARPLWRTAYCLRTLADLWLVQRAGVSLVWTVHNLVTHDTSIPRLERWFSSQLAKLADRLIVHSQAAREAVISQLGAASSKIAVIPHGPFRDAYGALPDRAAARAALGIAVETSVALFFGMIRPYKGVLALLRAWEALGDWQGDRLLIIAGSAAEPAYAAEIRTRAANMPRVRLDLRFVPDDDMLQLLAASDILVLPFQKSLTSGTVRLARDYGIPVVVSGVADAFEAPDTVLAVDTGPDALAQAILEGFARPATRPTGSATGWDEIAKSHQEVYESARAARRG